MYNEIVLDRFQNAKNAGIIINADAVGQIGSVGSGDIMKIYLRVEKGLIQDAKFKAFGCVPTIATADVTCDLLKGKTIEEALRISDQDVIKVLQDLPDAKLYCPKMAQETIQDAVEDYYKKLEREKKK